ncbi:uncharacterized protein Z520_01341 [Fonsecaea multimorphosa CBS 102226]|uniref:Uncharacterized protein n=1 Tax=Fonsecaea multimorphosa CBS 102226 TaxID=1442371 RepID=A0A0D2HLX3_9EURO|nr:uncharacterized protein Z520_01341 [Fonsecaea multimorphosa CBS 102226]KIY02876.1 hypothetical protein Z520_01341 [Fonsecaea multimorphosa CBS 102226]OAL30713.1 hypothetical protein AYO22_01333 [Fonsecaea multimorphosa]
MSHNEGAIIAPLKFLKWLRLYETEKPFQVFINIPEDAQDQRTTNLAFHSVEVHIQDVRNFPPHYFSLDKHGFMYRQQKLDAAHIADRDKVEELYLPEMEALLKAELGDVDRIFFFDWRLRMNAPEIEGTVIDLNDLTTWLRPALHVHVDQSPLAVIRRILMQLPSEAEHLLQSRIRVVNLWRPIIDCVRDYPLAICDGSTVLPSDMVEADHVRRHYTGSTMYLQHNERQKFFYMSRQTRDEILIFKNFDSAEGVAATCAPHASFLDPAVPPAFIPRQSIEVRALVFTYPPHHESGFLEENPTQTQGLAAN